MIHWKQIGFGRFRSGNRLVPLILLVVCLLGKSGFGQSFAAKQLERDLKFLETELPRHHVQPFAKLDETDFRRQVSQLRSKLPTLDYQKFQWELSRLVASLGDGHTGLQIDLSSMSYYPFNARWYDDQIMVVATEAKYSRLLGSRIVAINQIPIQTVLERLRPYYSVDNEFSFRQKMDYGLNQADLLAMVSEMSLDKAVTLKVEKDGETWEQALPAIEQPKTRNLKWESVFTKLPLPDRKANLDFWNDWLPDSKTVYFKYNRCRDLAGFGKLVQGTKGFMEQNNVERFVVDLRHNGGGNSMVFKPLVGVLSAEKSLQEPGRLFVIVGRGTFSSGIFAAYDMKRLGAIVVGEPTGGKPNHFGEVQILELPETKLKVSYSTKYWQFLQDSDPAFLEPDVRIQYTAQAALEGSDPALEAIQAYSPNKK